MGRTIAHAKCQRMPRQVGEACLDKSRQVGGDGDYPFAKSRSARYWHLRRQVWAYLSKSGLGKSTKKKTELQSEYSSQNSSTHKSCCERDAYT